MDHNHPRDDDATRALLIANQQTLAHIMEDHEKRLRWLEKWGWMIVGIMIAVSNHLIPAIKSVIAATTTVPTVLR